MKLIIKLFTAMALSLCLSAVTNVNASTLNHQQISTISVLSTPGSGLIANGLLWPDQGIHFSNEVNLAPGHYLLVLDSNCDNTHTGRLTIHSTHGYYDLQIETSYMEFSIVSNQTESIAFSFVGEEGRYCYWRIYRIDD